MHFFTVLVLVIAIAFVFITVQNPEPIEMTLATWHFSGPLAVILASFFGVGILAGIFLMIPTWWKSASQQVEQEGTVEAEKAPEKEKESEKIEEEKKSEF
jgi:uncharacterized integral membrane protein